MRLEDCPRTVVVDGKRLKRRVKRSELSPEDAHRQMLAQAQEVYRQALGCIVMMVNVPGMPLDALRTMREAGRDFLRAAGAQKWEMPAGVKPANQDRSTE